MIIRSLILIFAAISLSLASPIFSVLYFDTDQSNGSNALNKGLAEILSVEIQTRSDITVVERENLNKVVIEQEFALSGMIADSLVPEVGELLGVSHLITGTYMLAGETIMISVKMINVESGRIEGAARCSGSTREFASTTALLVTNTLKALEKMGVTVTKPVERVKKSNEYSIDAIFSYGEALHADDKGEKIRATSSLEELKSSVTSFTYADLSLNRINSRLEKSKKDHAKKLEKDASQLSYDYTTFMGLVNAHMMKMEYRQVLTICATARKTPFFIPGGAINGAELIEYYAITAAQALKLWDMVAEIGDAFIQDFPTSNYLIPVQNSLSMAIEELKKVEKVKKELKPQHELLSGMLKSATSETEKTVIKYKIGTLYYDKGIFRTAVKHYNSVDESLISKDKAIFTMGVAYFNTMNLDRARELRKHLNKKFPDSPYAKSMNSLLTHSDRSIIHQKINNKGVV